MFSFIVISAIFWIFTAAWFLVVQKPVFALYNRRLSAGQLTAATVTTLTGFSNTTSSRSF